MRKHGGTPSRRDKHVTLAAISPPGVARGRFVGGQQSGLAGSKPPPLFTREASSCSSQGRRQGEPWGASPRPSAPTYLPTYIQMLQIVFSSSVCPYNLLFRIQHPQNGRGGHLRKCCPGSLWVPEGSGPARPVGQAREESPWMLLLGLEPDTRTPTEARAATTEARSMLIVVRQKIPVYEEN